MRRPLTPERWAELRLAQRLSPIVEWDYRCGDDPMPHALTHRPRGEGHAIALDYNGHEYMVGSFDRQRPDGSREVYSRGILTHVVDPKGVATVAAVTSGPNHTADAEAIAARNGRPVVEALDRWVAEVRDWAHGLQGAREPRWLLLTGAPGAGKTTAAEYLRRRLALNGVIVPIVDWGGYVERCRESIDGGKRDRLTARVTVLDDVGADNATAYAAETLYRVLQEAEQAGRVVVATCNVSAAALQAQYARGGDGATANAERAVSRLQRRSRVVQLTAGAPIDMRVS